MIFTDILEPRISQHRHHTRFHHVSSVDVQQEVGLEQQIVVELFLVHQRALIECRKSLFENVEGFDCVAEWVDVAGKQHKLLRDAFFDRPLPEVDETALRVSVHDVKFVAVVFLEVPQNPRLHRFAAEARQELGNLRLGEREVIAWWLQVEETSTVGVARINRELLEEILEDTS
jgi:hypothetical protein